MNPVTNFANDRLSLALIQLAKNQLWAGQGNTSADARAWALRVSEAAVDAINSEGNEECDVGVPLHGTGVLSADEISLLLERVKRQVMMLKSADE